jgi:N utilization substance protein B
MRGTSPLELVAEREDADAYAHHLVDGVYARIEELDRLIASHARAWRPERMSSVDLNVMRVAALELVEQDVPAAAVIDEAVDIAKRFSGEDAGRFVNGVLEALRQSLEVGPTTGGGGAGGGSGSSGGGASGGVGSTEGVGSTDTGEGTAGTAPGITSANGERREIR